MDKGKANFIFLLKKQSSAVSSRILKSPRFFFNSAEYAGSYEVTFKTSSVQYSSSAPWLSGLKVAVIIFSVSLTTTGLTVNFSHQA